MWQKYVQPLLQWVSQVIQKPGDELDRWQRAARFSYDLARFGVRQMREDRAPQMAAALAFETLFALVPVLVMVMIIVRGIIGVPQFLGLTQGMLESAGLHNVTFVQTATPEEKPQTISLQQWIESLIGHAGRIDMNAVGWIGFGVILYAALSIMATIEKSFNTIYRAPEGRPWARRVPLYWFLRTASPLAISLTAFLHGRVETWAASLVWAPWLAVVIGYLWSICVSWLFWFAVYSLVPNISVNVRTSALGALVCVILLEAGKTTLGAYLSNAFSADPLYSSLGFIPLFIFWVYAMWLVVLFGLEVSATLQFLGNRAIEEMETKRSFAPMIDPTMVISVMQFVGENFQKGEPTRQRDLAHKVSISERVVSLVVRELCRAKMLLRVAADESSVSLARSPNQIRTDQLLDIGYRLVDEGEEERRWVSSFAKKLRDQQRAIAANTTLEDLLLTPAAAAPS